jgi:hypothetical protein
VKKRVEAAVILKRLQCVLSHGGLLYAEQTAGVRLR